MSKNRSKLPDVSALLKGPSPFEGNAERLAAMLSNPRANFPGMRAGGQRAEGDDELAVLAGAALKAGSDAGKVARHALERLDGVQANLQSLEQRMAVHGNSGFAGAFAPPSIGASIRQKIEAGEFDGFARFASGNSSKAALRLEQGIHAALVHEGSGSSSEAGTMPSQPSYGGIYGPVTRPLTLLDVLPVRQVTSDAVEYVRLGAPGDAAEQVAEGDEKQEVEFAGTPARAEITTVAVVTHASRQVLSDAVGLANIVDNTLRGKVASRLENQILNGPGGAGRIDGLLSLAAVHVPTATTPGDRIGEAVAGLAADGYKPNLIVLHPNDWFSITAERGGDQHYVLGLPTTPMRPTMWGCNVITTASIPEGRALVMDTTFATVLDRQKVDVAMSESHDRHFTRNLVAIRCELRAGLEFGDLDSAWQFDLTDASSS